MGLRASQAKRRTNRTHGLCLPAALAPPARAQESARHAHSSLCNPYLLNYELSCKRALSTARGRRAVDLPPAARQG